MVRPLPFAQVYRNLLQYAIKRHPIRKRTNQTNQTNRSISHELIKYPIILDPTYISVYSEKTSQVFPIMSAFLGLYQLLVDKTFDIQTKQAINELIASNRLSLYCIMYNTYIQFSIYDAKLIMIITSHSSNLLTELPIEAFHWQCLYWLFLNELNDVIGENVVRPGSIHYNVGSLYILAMELPIVKRFRYSSDLKKYEHTLGIYQTYSNVQNRAIKRLSTPKRLTHLLNIVDLGSFAQLNKLDLIFKNCLYPLYNKDI